MVEFQKTCKMSRRIRQWCPILALDHLYPFVAEILSLKRKDNNNIHGFKARMTEDIKCIQHADDLTLTLRDTLSLKNTFSYHR